MVEFNLNNLKVIQEDKKRTAFYASDVGKPLYELYHSFIGTPKSNPITWLNKLRFGAGNGVEEAMLSILKDSGIVNKDYDQTVHGLINYNKDNIEIHGRVDAITIDGYPIEIKSINNNNRWDISAYEDGYPRENYVGQLSIYMDALGKDKGYLFVASIDGLTTFLFECKREGDIFTCANTKFDLDKETKRWNNLYINNILNNIPPDVNEYRYKTPIEEIEWENISKNKIVQARSNRAVIGDFQVQYSSYKDMWIKEQGSEIGYTADEIAMILELTKGYTTW